MDAIENVFNYVRTKLLEGYLNRNITFEKFEEYAARVKEILLSVPVEYLNKKRVSIINRLSIVVKKRGKQIKY